jgi:hypothetical protein
MNSNDFDFKKIIKKINQDYPKPEIKPLPEMTPAERQREETRLREYLHNRNSEMLQNVMLCAPEILKEFLSACFPGQNVKINSKYEEDEHIHQIVYYASLPVDSLRLVLNTWSAGIGYSKYSQVSLERLLEYVNQRAGVDCVCHLTLEDDLGHEGSRTSECSEPGYFHKLFYGPSTEYYRYKGPYYRSFIRVGEI